MRILEIKQLVKEFGALAAVNNLSMNLDAGEIHAVIGPNGAGKTTLFNLITGVFSPNQGKIMFNGEDITNLSPYKINRRGLARSFQLTNIFQGLKVMENIRVACQALEKGLKMFSDVDHLKTTKERTENILKDIGLWEKRDQYAGNLSHGDQRRVEIGLALASGPKLLLLDEPTAGMTPAETKETMLLINGLRNRLTILLIEHDMDVVMGLSDIITVMQQGEKIAEGPPDQIKSNQKVIEAYFGAA